MARPTSETRPLATIRAMLLWALLAGSVGTLLELLFIGHDEMAVQLAPLILLATGILVVAWMLIAPQPHRDTDASGADGDSLSPAASSGWLALQRQRGVRAGDDAVTCGGIAALEDADWCDARARARLDVVARVRGIGFCASPSPATMAADARRNDHDACSRSGCPRRRSCGASRRSHR